MKHTVHMPRLLCLLLAAALILSGCGPSQEEPQPEGPAVIPQAAPLPPGEVAEGILLALGREAGELEEISGGDADFYLTELYGLPEGSWEDVAIWRAGGTEAFEIAVILLAGTDTEAALAGLNAYREARQGDFTGYAPEQAAIAAAAETAAQGRYAALLICEVPDAALEAFTALAGGTADVPAPPEPEMPEEPEQTEGTGDPAEEPVSPEPERPADPQGPEPVTYPGRKPYTQPGLEDMTLYDGSAVLAAWRGEARQLAEQDAAVLEAARAVLAETVTEDMTPAQKERSIYRWLVGSVAYDQSHYDPLTGAPRSSYTPYGPLLEGKGVCLGFASTFQLLLDMCGVECLTVVGAAYSSREDHAWNMVRLDGNWYCVDPTWDAGRADSRLWLFFNVTSSWMALTDHQWDYSAVPEAEAEDGGELGGASPAEAGEPVSPDAVPDAEGLPAQAVPGRAAP